MRSTLTRLVSAAPIVFIVALLVLGGSTPASAEITCFMNLRSCFFRAANTDTWGSMWLMGLDCELNFADCGRRALIGR
jgi:hypothetical protein